MISQYGVTGFANLTPESGGRGRLYFGAVGVPGACGQVGPSTTSCPDSTIPAIRFPMPVSRITSLFPNSCHELLRHMKGGLRRIVGGSYLGTGAEGAGAQHLRRGGVGVLITAAALAISLLQSIVLARILGPEGYGVYAFVFAVVSVMVIPIQFGIVNLLVRETAHAHAHEDWPAMLGVWAWASRSVWGLSALYCVCGAVGMWWGVGRFGGDQLATFALGVLLVPLIGLGNIRGAALRGLRLVVHGRLPAEIVRPGLFVALVGGAWFGLPVTLGPAEVMGLHGVAAALALAGAMVLLRRARPGGLDGSLHPRIEHRAWLGSAFPLMMAAGLQLLNNNSDLLMLGWLGNATDVGIYNVVIKGAALVIFGLQVANMVFTPYFARLHAEGDYVRLRAVARVGVRLTLVIALPVAAVFVLFAEDILRSVFGESFTPGALPLAVLAAGQLVNAASGAQGVLLAMTGHERDVAKAVGFGALANVILNAILIPPFGMTGAATASVVAMSIYSIILKRIADQRIDARITGKA